YLVDIIFRNDGSAVGIGVATSTCRLNITVNMVPLPPVPTITSFSLPELSANGTLVGNVMATDPANFTITRYQWQSVDSPNAFAINSSSGNITVAQVVD